MGKVIELIQNLIPHGKAYDYLGLSRAVFDRDIRPKLREAKVGRRLLFSIKELDAVAEQLLAGDNVSAAGVQETARRFQCRKDVKGEHLASTDEVRPECGTSRSEYAWATDGQSNFKRQLERVLSPKRSDTSLDESSKSVPSTSTVNGRPSH